MEISKKITRLFISTGYYHNLIIATLIEQISLPNLMYEDYLILSTVGQDLQKNLQMLKLLECNFKNTYLTKVTKDTETIKVLKEKCQGLIFDEIYVDPIVLPVKFFQNNSHIHTKYYGVEEGILSYIPNYRNKENSGLRKYLLYPEIYFNQTNVIALNHEILRKNLSKISINNNKKYNKNSIIFITGGDNIDKQIAKQLINYFNLLTDKGYTIYIKDHPRLKTNWKAIVVKCKEPEKIIVISEEVLLVEQLIPIVKPKIIVGLKSTSLLAGYYFYNIPTFRVCRNFKNLHYKYNTMEQILYCIPHLEDFLKQNKYNALEYCNNYSFFYLSTFQNLLIKESWYLPIKLQIHLKSFFQTNMIKSFKYLMFNIYYLLKYKYFK